MVEIRNSSQEVPTIPTQRGDSHPHDSWCCERPRRDVAVCTVTGDIDAGTAGVLERTLRAVESDRNVRAIVVDLSGVDFLAVTGVSVLLRAAGRTAADRRELVVVLATIGAHRAFEVTGADAVIPWYSTRADAVTAAAICLTPGADVVTRVS